MTETNKASSFRKDKTRLNKRMPIFSTKVVLDNGDKREFINMFTVHRIIHNRMLEYFKEHPEITFDELFEEAVQFAKRSGYVNFSTNGIYNDIRYMHTKAMLGQFVDKNPDDVQYITLTGRALYKTPDGYYSIKGTRIKFKFKKDPPDYVIKERKFANLSYSPETGEIYYKIFV